MRPDHPFPVRPRHLPEDLPAVAGDLPRIRARVRHPAGDVVVELRTDSPHLAEFFSLNWSPAPAAAAPDCGITVLRGDAASYGLPGGLDGTRWYSRSDRTVFYFGHESYANLKITVRGLLSEISDSTLWLHGTSLAVDVGGVQRGVVLLGRSGAGKTTLTACLRRLLGDRVRVVNDDWGPVCLTSLTTTYTAEQRLHMKYLSVSTLRPDLAPTPATHRSEHFSGDRSDPVGRLLIGPTEVFGSAGVAQRTGVDLLVLLRRGLDVAGGIHPAGPDHLDVIDAGEYAEFYDGVERFYNGSLFLPDETYRARHRRLFDRLLRRLPLVVLGNVDSPQQVADTLLRSITDSPRIRRRNDVVPVEPGDRSTARKGSVI